MKSRSDMSTVRMARFEEAYNECEATMTSANALLRLKCANGTETCKEQKRVEALEDLSLFTFSATELVNCQTVCTDGVRAKHCATVERDRERQNRDRAVKYAIAETKLRIDWAPTWMHQLTLKYTPAVRSIH